MRTIKDGDLDSLTARDILFLVDAYVTPTEITDKLLRFVEGGGHLIIFDAPSKSISDPAMQRLTGFSDGCTWHRTDHAILRPVGDSSLVPTGGTAVTADQIEQIDRDWLEYRTQAVTDLVSLVYRGVKSARPNVSVSAFVWADIDGGRSYAQDWPHWLREGIIDFVMPMAYTTDDETLAEQLATYADIDPSFERILPALSLYHRPEGTVAPRPPEMVLGQIDLCREAGARGVELFAMTHLSDEVLSALSAGPFREPATAYVPVW